jgi:hypothetical protein
MMMGNKMLWVIYWLLGPLALARRLRRRQRGWIEAEIG